MVLLLYTLALLDIIFLTKEDISHLFVMCLMVTDHLLLGLSWNLAQASTSMIYVPTKLCICGD